MVVIAYLVAIVLANLSISYFGASASVVNAFVFIAFDLSARDILHERWKQNLWVKMLALIVGGGVLSALFSLNAVNIAVASCVAFIGSGVADTFVYRALGDKTYLVKANGSNIVGALVDSLLFTALAFGSLTFALPQFVAKIAGGFIWSILLNRVKLVV